MKGIYADYADKFKAKPVIIDIDIYDDYAEVESEPPVMSEIMERDVNKVLAEPYRKMMEMQENIISSGENYIVSTKCKYPREVRTGRAYGFIPRAGEALTRIRSTVYGAISWGRMISRYTINSSKREETRCWLSSCFRG